MTEVVSERLSWERNPDTDGLILEVVAKELEDQDTVLWFAMLAESGPGAIEAQAWQLEEALVEKRIAASLREVQDAMLQLAHELLDTEDPRDELFRKAASWASARTEAEQERLARMLDDGYQEAWEGSVYGLRLFLRRCCETAKEAA